MSASNLLAQIDARKPEVIDAERQLLVDLLGESPESGEVAAILSPQDFYDSLHAELYAVVMMLLDSGKNLRHDPLTQLRLAGASPEIANADFLIDLFTLGKGSGGFTLLHAKTVLAASRMRQHQQIAEDYLRMLSDATATPEKVAQSIESKIKSLGCFNVTKTKSFDDTAAKIIASLDSDRYSKPSIMTGIVQVDELTGGIRGGELVTIAGRPGDGKTAYAMQLARFSASCGRGTLFVSLEMTAEELVKRTLCGEADVDSRAVRAGQATEADKLAIIRAADKMRGYPMEIFDPSSATIAQVRAEIRRSAMRGDLELAVVDYVQIMQVAPESSRKQRHEQIAEMTGGLKSLAKELDIPIVMLAQLNREAEKGAPQLSHLKESGAIEQDSDLVFFVHKPDRIKEPTRAQLICAKHRHGVTGTVELEWVAKRVCFQECNTAKQWDY